MAWVVLVSGHQRWIGRIFFYAGLYGIVALLPLYFLENQLGQRFPPATNRPEQFYGFLGVALAWQWAFLLIAKDVWRYRVLMLPAAAEKFLSAGSAVWLFLIGRVDAVTVAPAVIDLALGCLFLLAYVRCAPSRPSDAPVTPG